MKKAIQNDYDVPVSKDPEKKQNFNFEQRDTDYDAIVNERVNNRFGQMSLNLEE